jgi:hypothetical protein
MTANIFETVLENINADKKAWCKSEWSITDGGTVSRCLVEHVDLATGVSYVKVNKDGTLGKRFVSKSKAKWRRRNEVLRKLAMLLPYSDPEYVERYLTAERDDEAIDQAFEHGWLGAADGTDGRISTTASNQLVNFNDGDKTTKADVKRLLKKAIKTYGQESK